MYNSQTNRTAVHLPKISPTFSERAFRKIGILSSKFSGRLSDCKISKQEKAYFVPNTFNQFEECATQWLTNTELSFVLDSIKTCDAIVINGEGSFRGEGIPGRLKLFLTFLAKEYFNKPTIIINHTADVRHPNMFEMAKHIYPLFEDVVFREPFSYEKTGPLRNDKPYTMAADAVFTYEPIPRLSWQSVASRENYFGIYPYSALSFNPCERYICVGGSAAHQDDVRKEFNAVKELTSLCLELQKLCPVILTGADFVDEDVLSIVADELNLPYLPTNTPTYQAIDILNHASIYIGGRWHPSIMALTGGTPIISLSANTSYKSQGILRLVGLDDQPNFDFFEVGKHVKDIADLSSNYLEQEDSLREKLLAKTADLRRSAYDNVRFLARERGD